MPMRLLPKLLFVLYLILSFNANAYSGPRGLYVLEYPVNMPDIAVTSEYNNPTQILNTSADLTVMIFWSQTCAPCLREMKDLEAFYHKTAIDNINVMLISPAAEWTNLTDERMFLAKYGAPSVPFYNDVNNQLSLSLGIGSTPYTVIMDKNGKKVATMQGEANWSSAKLYKMIKNLIK